MNTRSLLLAFAISAAAVSPALADQARTAKPEAAASAGGAATTASTTAGEAGSAAAQPRKICRREGATGSRTSGARICMTKEQWREVDRGGEVTILRERNPTRR
jgi:hypothetical protein